MARIGIDMGHTLRGAGTGAKGYKSETDMNRKAGKRLMEMLKEHGHTVVNCTVDKSSSDLAARCKKANAQKLDLFISLHLNAFKKVSQDMGVETFVCTGTSKAKSKALAIQKELVKNVGWKSRGVKTAGFYVLRNTNAPAILVELGFCDSKADMNKWNTEKIAASIFKGITGKTYSKKSSSKPKPPAKPSKPAPAKKPESSKKPAGFKIGDYSKNVKINSNINVRSGRGTEHKIIGGLKKGAVVKVGYILPDNRDGKGDNSLWGSITINGKTGFICLNYAKPQ